MMRAALLLLLACKLMGAPALAAQVQLDDLLGRLPPDSHLTLVAELENLRELYDASRQRLRTTPLVAENPDLAELFERQNAMLDAGLEALRTKLGFDPFTDLSAAAAGIALRPGERSSQALVLRGRFPPGLAARLADGSQARAAGAQRAYALEGGLWLAQSAGVLVVATAGALERALVGGDPAPLRDHVDWLAAIERDDCRMAASFAVPAWLRKMADRPELSALRSLLLSLDRIGLLLTDGLRIRVGCLNPSGAERAEMGLRGLKDMLLGQAHLLRAYTLLLFVMSADLPAGPGIPPQLRTALANRESLRRTIDDLVPSPDFDLQLARQGNSVDLSLPTDMLYGTVAVTGVLAAVAIPAFIQYIRRSKLSEVHPLLDQCVRTTIAYCERPRVRPDGTTVSATLPRSMQAAICPGGVRIADLDGSSAPIPAAAYQAGGAGEVLAEIGWVIREPVYGCYWLEVDSPGHPLQEGIGFTCHAYIDIDEDGRPAHFTKRATYSAARETFISGPVERDPLSDEQ